MYYVLLMLVLGLLVAWYFYRQGLDRPGHRTERRIATPRGNETAYHAVSIRFEVNACNAAKALAGTRFLATEAPDLPLPECEMTLCKCRFVHHKDRRAGKDRRSPFTSGGIAAATGKYAQERREGQERRDDTNNDDLY
jgi:hypothetical protein